MSRRERALVLGTLLLVFAYYLVRLAVGAAWGADAAYLAAPSVAVLLLWRRAGRETGRAGAFFRLLAAGAGLWCVGQVLWVVAAARGLDPAVVPDPLAVPADAFFVGFLVPMIGAVALHPHRREGRPDAVAFTDVGLLWATLSFVFARFVAMPRVAPSDIRGALLALLCFCLALWAAALWRTVDDPAWRRTYGYVCAFGVAYGVGSAAANGWGRTMAPAGGPLDLAWILPFALLALAAFEEARPAAGWSAFGVLLMAGLGPLALDVAADVLVPRAAGPGHATHVLLLLPTAAVLAVGCALRLHLQGAAEARARTETQARSEERQRAVRLATLASLTGAVLEELQVAMADVVTGARSAAESIGEKGDRVVAQAERAARIVRDLMGALRLARSAPPREVPLGALLEDSVHQAVAEGLGLEVSLEGLADLPKVMGDPAALQAAFRHLLRNAAQASPGGTLRIVAGSRGGEALVRFVDDGPGVPEEMRPRIFDPFFTTRRVGEGVGLGLTHVHFVARDHGGAIVLEAGEGGGASFLLRLPAAERRDSAPGAPRTPLAVAVLLGAATATLLAVLPPPTRGVASGLLQCAAALGAAVMLARAAALRRGRERRFWMLLAAGPTLWCAVRAYRVHAGLLDGPTTPLAGWLFAAEAGTDLLWAAALLLRPDRRPDSVSRVPLLGTIASFLAVAYVDAFLILLPAPYAAVSPAVVTALVVARGALCLCLALWVGALWLGAATRRWRDAFGRLAEALALWAVGQTIAGYAATVAGYQSGWLSDVGWILPYLLLAALGTSEAAQTAVKPGHVDKERSPWTTVVSLGALVAVPLFDALFGATSLPGLESARTRLTRVTLVVLGLVLIVREVLARGEVAETRARLMGTRARLASAERRSRAMALMGGAVHELAGHLSGVRALTRLLLSHPELSPQARGDAERIQAGSEAATRIVRNLLPLLRRSPEALTLASLNNVVRQVVEARQDDLAEERILLRHSLARDLPLLPLDGAALQQVVVGLVDNAAVAIRKQGRDGTIDVTTLVEGEEIVLRVSDDGPGLPDVARRRLASAPFGPGSSWTGPGFGLHVAREIVLQHGGRISGRDRLQGGAVVEIRLPIAHAADIAG